MNGTFEQMMPPGAEATLPEPLELHEKMMSAHLSVLRTLKEAVDPLYAALGDDRRRPPTG